MSPKTIQAAAKADTQKQLEKEARQQLEDLLTEAIGEIKGIDAWCERHANYPWQLHCDDCRQFVVQSMAHSLLPKLREIAQGTLKHWGAPPQ